MFKDLSPKKRFGLTLIPVYLVSLPFTSTITCFTLRQRAVRDAYNLGRLKLTTMQAKQRSFIISWLPAKNA